MTIIDVYNRFPIKILRGEGVYIYDDSGRSYLDFTSGLGAVGLGHCHPYLLKKLQEQTTKLWHCSNLFCIPEQEQLAKRLSDATFAEKIFFCSSGLEAVETLIKAVRRYYFVNGKSNKYRIITLKDGFHGRSMGCISAGGNIKSKEGYMPLLDGFDIVNKNNIDEVQAAITPKTAAIFLEPIQAEGGVYAFSADYLKALRRLANSNDLLLCFDEVQCGYGRACSLFHYQNIGVQPDILSTAKAMGNGFPLGACLMIEKVGLAMSKGSHGSTYGGNPMAMSVGNAVLDLMLEEGFFAKVKDSSEYLLAKLSQLRYTFADIISEITGHGMILGINLSDPKYREPLILKCLYNGLALTRTAKDSMIRVLPPLITKHSHIDQAYEILKMSLLSLREIS